MEKFAVLGEDRRQWELRRLIRADGYTLCAPGEAEAVILPLPSEDSGLLPPELRPGALIIGGRLSAALHGAAEARGLRAIDYVLREDFATLNACATAEGAIQLIMENTETTVAGLRALTVGNGRIGRLLARKLRALGAVTAVSARRAEDLAEVENAGHRALKTAALDKHAGDFDVIINTVPAPVIGEDLINALKPGTLIIDLASLPGGVDFEAAEGAGIRALRALSLPGKVAPVSAAGYAYRSIRNIIAEVEDNG